MLFSAADIPSLIGKVAIVTGANTGIGKITCLELARKGAHVIMACRNEEKAKPAIDEVIAETKNSKVEFGKLDLNSLKSVDEFVSDFKKKNLPLHILVNNAGIMALPKLELSKDGIESQFATNHLGHYLLTRLLLPVLKENQPSRIVCVSSSLHRSAPKEGILFDNYNDPKFYDAWKMYVGTKLNCDVFSYKYRYGQSKLANILFAKELQRRVNSAGHEKIYVNSLHPGVIWTELMRHQMPGWVYSLIQPIHSIFWISPEKGALTQLYCATSPEIESKSIKAEFFVPIAKLSKPVHPGANDAALAEKLWIFSENLVIEKLGTNPFER